MSDEEKTYDEQDPLVALHPHKLPYGSNVGAPAIRPGDATGWKLTRATKTNHYFETKYEDLKKEFEDLVKSYETNILVYGSKFNFEPVIGYTYHLYENSKEELFLSLIGPDEWDMKYIGSYVMDSDNKWVEVDG